MYTGHGAVVESRTLTDAHAHPVQPRRPYVEHMLAGGQSWWEASFINLFINNV